jgi:hypothetical protein
LHLQTAVKGASFSLDEVASMTGEKPKVAAHMLCKHVLQQILLIAAVARHLLLANDSFMSDLIPAQGSVNAFVGLTALYPEAYAGAQEYLAQHRG